MDPGAGLQEKDKLFYSQGAQLCLKTEPLTRQENRRYKTPNKIWQRVRTWWGKAGFPGPPIPRLTDWPGKQTYILDKVNDIPSSSIANNDNCRSRWIGHSLDWNSFRGRWDWDLINSLTLLTCEPFTQLKDYRLGLLAVQLSAKTYQASDNFSALFWQKASERLKGAGWSAPCNSVCWISAKFWAP